MMRATRESVLAALRAGTRFDGRKLTEFRPVSVSVGVTRSAEGSARVRVGDTDLFVGVKMGLETPYPDTPNKGNLMVNAELRPLSNSKFELGPPGDEAVELARVVDRGIRESGAIDVHKLCVTEGELVWSVMIDVCTVNASGNLIDASALGALAALVDSRLPGRDGKVVDYEKKTSEKLPLKSFPVAITVCKIGEFFLVDLLPEEEVHVDARLTVTLTEKNHICALQKGGVAPLTSADIMYMVDVALKIAPELRKNVSR